MNGILNNLSGRSNKFYLSLTAISLIFTLLLNFYAKISETTQSSFYLFEAFWTNMSKNDTNEIAFRGILLQLDQQRHR